MIAHTSKGCLNFCNGANGALKIEELWGVRYEVHEIGGITASDAKNMSTR
jgi:hypothetical protein